MSRPACEAPRPMHLAYMHTRAHTRASIPLFPPFPLQYRSNYHPIESNRTQQVYYPADGVATRWGGGCVTFQSILNHCGFRRVFQRVPPLRSHLLWFGASPLIDSQARYTL